MNSEINFLPSFSLFTLCEKGESLAERKGGYRDFLVGLN